jgi:ankyrin repeat protein
MLRKWIRLVAYLYIASCFSSSFAGTYVDFFRAVNLDLASTVTQLVASGFDPNSLSETGQTALYLALRDDSPAVVEVLVANPKVDIDMANAVGETPLMMAALRGHTDVARKLIARGAKVRRSGWTPLHYAASGPSVQAVALMLEHGADVNAGAPNLNTPLMMAARNGPEESVSLLLARGADKARVNDKGQTAMDFAETSGRAFIVEMLRR